MSEDLKSIASSLQHIGFIDEKLTQMQTRRGDAVDQLVHRIGRTYDAGLISDPELGRLYEAARALSGPGFMARWDAAVSFKADKLRAHNLGGPMAPNGPADSWWGKGRPTWNVDPCPPLGCAVVYVLYDANWEPVYLGSTGQFRQRIKRHLVEKTFTYWRAWPCRDRKHAYQREADMLETVMPQLNRKRETSRTTTKSA